MTACAMYPDPLTPKAYPEALQDIGYDPFGLMPASLPPPPRVFLSATHIERARELIHVCDWASNALELLEANCRLGEEPSSTLPVPADSALNGRMAQHAQRNALAALLTDKAEYRDHALAAFRLLARAYPQWPLTNGDVRAAGGGLAESRMILRLGITYDLLAAQRLPEDDDTMFREMLEATVPVSDGSKHFTCGNHNTASLVARLAVALALGNRQGIHDALYGCDRGSKWRYGLIHQLRHDILSDGLQWERAPGYHLYTLMEMTDAVCMLQNVGIDLWHVELPAQHQDDGHDLHRAYEPRGTKCLKAAFDAPFFCMSPNGDFSLLHDSGLANIRGAYVWGILYNRAYEAYGDPKYAWLLRRMEEEYPIASRRRPELPMPLNTDMGDMDFARLRDASYPEGRFSFADECAISLNGRHEDACSLFPVHGSAVIRSNPDSEEAVGAFLFWGPHSAGHQGPAALHLDMSARGRRLTDAPRTTTYEDPNYLTWNRATIAHNTVTVDESSMFPYDFDTDSIWEADRWRDRVSDGQLELFQTDTEFKAVRASNENVYPGVRLDRMVIVTEAFVLDVYRVLSEVEHQYDWAMHVAGTLVTGLDSTPFTMPDKRGYRHFRGTRRLPLGDTPLPLRWQDGDAVTSVCLLPPPGAILLAADDPPTPDEPTHGELSAPGPRSTLIVRCRATSAVFLSLWTFEAELEALLGPSDACARRDLALEARVGRHAAMWHLPFKPTQVRMDT